MWSSVGIVHQSSLWLTGFRFEGFDRGLRIGRGRLCFTLGIVRSSRWNLESSHQYAGSARPILDHVALLTVPER